MAEQTDTYNFYEAGNEEGHNVEFRLVYKGSLPAHGSEVRKYKHMVRTALHPQLKELWHQHRFLQINLDYFARNYQRCGFQFVPLINRDQGKSCVLDILFLRRDSPGNLVKSGGDIDNRIKILFDGLRIPQTCDEVSGQVPTADQDPFFCLLEDDAMITEVNITTDRLLVPTEEGERIHDVLLVIRVRTTIPEFLGEVVFG